MEPTLPQKPFISSVEAAKRFDITNDYVGALCRRGKVRGFLVGRLWFVDENALEAYLKAMQAQRAAQRELLSKAWQHAWTLLLLVTVLGIPATRADADGPTNARMSVPDAAIQATYEAELAIGQAYWMTVEVFVDASSRALDAASAAYIGAVQALVDTVYRAHDAQTGAYQEMGASMADGAQEIGAVYGALVQWYAQGAERAAERLNTSQAAPASIATAVPTVAHPLAQVTFPLSSSSTSHAVVSAPSSLPATNSVSSIQYISRDELLAQLADLKQQLEALVDSRLASAAAVATGVQVPQQVAGGGYGAVYGATAAPPMSISQVVSSLTAADIPALDYFPSTSTIAVAYGGTGTSTAPGANQVMLADANGNWEYVATSSLGITGGGSVTYATNSTAVYSSYSIVAWGDSLTAGNEDGTGVTYPSKLSTDLGGRTVTNKGVGGQTSTQIGVRQGGVSTTATISGGQIPASGGVTVTFPSGYEPVTSQGPAGGVSGTLSGVAGTVTLSGGTYTFTRQTAGSAVNVSSATFVVDTGTLNNGTVIIWAGRNNLSNPTQVESDIDAMVSSLGSNTHYLILSVVNGSGEGTGTGNYTNIASINSYLSAHYSGHYLDIRSYLISSGLSDAGITPTGQDNTDIADDIVPTSLRFDSVHLNASGYTVMAQQVANFITDNLDTASSPVITASTLPAVFASPYAIGATAPGTGVFTTLGVGTSTVSDLVDVAGNVGLSNSTTRSIYLRGGNAASTLNFDFPELTSNTGSFRFFRGTNTTGNSNSATALQIFKGDGSGSLQTSLAAFNSSYLNALGGNVGIGTTTPLDKLSVNGTFGLTAANAEFYTRNGNAGTTISFDFPELTSASGLVRFFRTTNSSTAPAVQIFKGDGTSNVQAFIQGYGTTYFNALAGNAGIGTTSPYALFSIATQPGAQGTLSTLFAIASSTSNSTTTLFSVSNAGNVGIGTTSPFAKLSVVGKGYFTDSIASALNSNAIVIGTGPAANYNSAVELQSAITSATNAHGYGDHTTFTSTVDGNAYASFTANTTIGGTFNYDHYNSYQAGPNINTTGTTTLVRIFTSGPNVANGTVTNLYHFKASDVVTSGGASVTNQYGLYLDGFVGATNNWGVYVLGPQQNYFGGTVNVPAIQPLNTGTAYSSANMLTVIGSTTLSYVPGVYGGLLRVGNQGDGGSLWVNTPSYSSTFPSGLGVGGSYDSGTKTSLINLNAYGVNSAGSFRSNLAFSTTFNGALAEAMRIDSSGRVGIGTTSPYSMLSVAGQVVGQNFVATSTSATSTFSGGLSAGGSTGLTVLQNGTVGVGTASPLYKLHVSASTNTTAGTNAAQLSFFSAAPASAAAANYIGLFGETNYNSSFTNTAGGAVIGVRGEGYVSNARSEVVEGLEGLAISNSSDTSAMTTSLYGARVQSQNTGTGRITHGIGLKVMSPVNNGTVDDEFGVYIGAISGGTANSALHIEGSGSGNAITFSGDGSSGLNSKIYSSAANQLNIEASSNLLLNTLGGNVGIGTTTPGSLLSVGGTNGINFSTATSTFSTTGGINITEGCYAVNGTCLSSGAGGGTFSWTPTTNFGAAANSTSTAIWFQSGLQSSSTIQTTGLNVWPATSTVLSYQGQDFLSASSTTSSIVLGLGTGHTNTGSNNNFFGVSAGGHTTSGTSNNFFGTLAGYGNTVGSNNTAFGDSAMLYSGGSVTGSFNTAIGSSAMGGGVFKSETGSYNVALGYNTLSGVTGGSTNVAIGYKAGQAISTGSDNTLVGNNAGTSLTTGYANLLLGVTLGTGGVPGISTGFGNIGIGNNIFFPSATGNQQLNIGNLLYGTLPATTTTYRLPTSGAIGIGTSSPYAKLSVALNNGDTSGYAFAIGSSTASATTTLLTVTNAGNVGIGTTSPAALLAVEGTANSTPAFIASQLGTATTSSTLIASFLSTASSTNSSLTSQIGSIRGLTMSVKGSVTDGTKLLEAYGLAVAGRYAYVSGGFTASQFSVVDISNPSSPAVVGSVDNGTYLYDGEQLAVSGHYAYVAASSQSRVTVVDVSNPALPQVVGSVFDGTKLNNLQKIAIQGNYLYAAVPNSNYFTVIDISNPAAPTIVGSVTDATKLNGARYVAVAGRYAYVTAGNGNRLTVIDISSPTNPVIVSSLNDATNLSNPQDIVVSGRYAYVVAYSAQNRFTVVDISNPTSPTVVGSVQDATYLDSPENFAVAGRYAYVISSASAGHYLTIVDVANPAAPKVVGSLKDNALFNSPETVAISGRYAYVTSFSNNSLAIVDIAGLEIPTVQTGSLETMGLNVLNSQSIGQNLTVGGGLTVGNGIFSNGQLAINASEATSTLGSSYSALSITHSTSTFSGTGILLDFAKSSFNSSQAGSFTGNFVNFRNGGISKFLVTSAGNVGVGTTTPFANLSIHANNGSTNTTLFAIASSTASATTTLLSVSNTGLTTFTGTGGTCTINGSGACTSDERLKTNIAPISGVEALEKLANIKGVTYNWDDPALDQRQRVGVLAQDVLAAFPQLVGSTTVNFKGVSGTYYTVDYAGLTAPLISAVNELNLNLGAISGAATTSSSAQQYASNFFSYLFGKLTSWLADAANGIGKLFAREVHTHELCVSDDSGAETCVTKAQLDSLLAGAVAAQPQSTDATTAGDSDATATPDTQAPVLTVLGAQKVTVAVNATYIDLGASVTDNVNKNLGYKVSLDGGATTSPDQLVLDTSAAGTHIITFSATDQAGNVGYATRTVIVGSTQPATQDTATSTPTTIESTPEATSTPATSTPQS